MGKKTHHYTKEEQDALHYYKYHPYEIHRILRENRHIFSGSLKDEVQQVIKTLENIFNNENKIFRTSETKILYRALQDTLSPDEINSLCTIGGVYKDKSFVATTTSLEVAQAFSCANPILEITLPKNSKYIDVDGLFNIDRRHWKENELLLNKNSKFLITGFDTENNIIKCNYLDE